MIFVKRRQAFSNGPRSLPRKSAILDSWVFANVIWTDESFAKALWSLETCVPSNNNLCRK